MNDESANLATEDQAAETVSAPPTLKQRAISGSLWTLMGYGTNQVLRLVGNLFLTRLLFPEAFGLMALVQTFLTGLNMFSDIGVFPNIIQSNRGDEPAFLNTAWTLQALRGGILWIGSCLLAYPAALFFKEPILIQILPISGLSTIISGFASTKLATANRHLTLGRLTLIDLGSYIVGLGVMVLGAWLYRSVWALVIGGLVGNLLRTIASHVFLEGEPNRLCWEKEALELLRNFGRWIFLSTVFGFFAAQGDRLMLARLLDIRFLGIYTVALGLSAMADQIVDQVSSRVLFPSYSELVRERPERLYSTLLKSRIILVGISLICSLFLVLFGNLLIDYMYDDRYIEAGWMLRVLAIGSIGRTLTVTYGDVLLAKGKTFTMMVLLVITTTVQFIAMFLGSYWGGYKGLIIAIALAHWFCYAVDSVCYFRLGFWQPEIDFPIVFLALAMAGIVFYFN
jgi:O-antigen/teichoic acid export membrane protein